MDALCLFLPGRRDTNVVPGVAFRMAEQVPIGHEVIGLVPHWNPIVTGAQDAIDRAADKGQLLARLSDQGFF